MPSTRSSGMHIRVNPEIKANVEPILTAIGLSFSDVFNLTLNQIYLKRKLHFELSSAQFTENGYILRTGNLRSSNSKFPVCSNRQFRTGISFYARAWYTVEFEAEILAEAEECYVSVANGAKTYRNAAELRAALDAEENDE